MKIQEIPNIGISGIKVEFNHSELVVLKDLQIRMNEAVKEVLDAEMPLNQSSRVAVQQASQLLSKIVPEQVMSIVEAELELFDVKEEVEKH